MQNYLQQILTESNTIIIPGLGALTITSTKTGDIYFMPFLKHDDGTLAKHIATVEGIELTEAKNTITNFVSTIQTALENGESYEMAEFGRFIKNQAGEFEFQRWEDYQVKDTSILSKKVKERKLTKEKIKDVPEVIPPVVSNVVKEENIPLEEPIKTDEEIHQQIEEELPISVNPLHLSLEETIIHPIEEPETHQPIAEQKSIDALLHETENEIVVDTDSTIKENFEEPEIISNAYITPIEEDDTDVIPHIDTPILNSSLEELIEAPEKEILAETDPTLENIIPTVIETKADKKSLRKKQKMEAAAAKAEEKRLKKAAKLEEKLNAKNANPIAPKEKKKSRSMILWLFFAILITAGTMWYVKTQRDGKVHLTVIDKKESKIVTTKVVDKKELHKEIAKHSTKENKSEINEHKVAESPKKPEVEKQKIEVKKTIVPVKPIKEVVAKKENTDKEKNEIKAVTTSTVTKIETAKNATTLPANTKTDVVAKGNVKSPVNTTPSVSASTPIKSTIAPKTEKVKPAINPANAVVITTSTPIIKPVPAPPKPVAANTTPANKNIQVIVGTFKDRVSADQFVSNLKADGFTTAYHTEKNGTFEVNLGKYNTLSETSKALQKYRGVKK